MSYYARSECIQKLPINFWHTHAYRMFHRINWMSLFRVEYCYAKIDNIFLMRTVNTICSDQSDDHYHLGDDLRKTHINYTIVQENDTPRNMHLSDICEAHLELQTKQYCHTNNCTTFKVVVYGFATFRSMPFCYFLFIMCVLICLLVGWFGSF